MLPQPGQRAIVKEMDPPVYRLPPGLRAGDLVTLIEFTPGSWEVRRELDNTIHIISMVLIDRVLD